NFEKNQLTTEEILQGLPDFAKSQSSKNDSNGEEELEETGTKRKNSEEENGEFKKLLKTNSPAFEKMLVRQQSYVGCNTWISRLVKDLKSECLFFIKMVGSLKLWIQLNIPKIEDGNNFGVTIQEEIVTELASKENHAFNIMEEMMKYYSERARIVKRILKYPKFEDFKNALVEHDDRAFIMFRMDFLDMRNYYITLLDVIKKNYEKIKKPRGNGSSYHSMF
ncbi:hypothetical protein MHBO_001774, partial [Bonamia ostreae]